MSDKEFPNSGAMYVNKNRREGKNDATGKGRGELTCENCSHKNHFWIDGWRKDKDNGKPDKNGDPWYSFAFKHKQQPAIDRGETQDRTPRPAQQTDMGYSKDRSAPPRSQRPLSSEIDDEIPF